MVKMSRVVSGTQQKNNNFAFLLWMSLKVTKEPELDYDQIMIHLIPAYSISHREVIL
jgi:hypothetical protein